MKEKDKLKIIELLRDDNEYYNGVGRGYLSVSNIDMMMKTPEMFLEFMSGNWDQQHLPSFTIGQALHTLVLEGEGKFNENFTVVDASTRNTNIYKNAEGGDNRILLKEFEMVESMYQRLSALSEYDDVVADMFSHFTGYSEVPNLIEIDGVLWKMKADKLSNDQIIDLKTTSDIDRFAWSADTYNYDAQAALYSKAFGKPMKFVVIEKKTNRVAIADCSTEFIDRGWKKIEEANVFFKSFIKPALDGENPDFNKFRTYITL